MAELAAVERLAASARGIPARTQLLAVAWLRWRIFVNSIFRRRPAGARHVVGLALAILLRLILWPFLALAAIGPIAGSGFFAWIAIAEHHPQSLLPLFAGITLLWQFVAINGLSIAAAVSSFDPSSLARFPLRFGRYLVLRTTDRPDDAKHHRGLSRLAGCCCGNRRGELQAGAARRGCSGGLRANEHISHAHDWRVDGALARKPPLPRVLRRADGADGRWISVSEFSAGSDARPGRERAAECSTSCTAPAPICIGCHRVSPPMRSCATPILLRRLHSLRDCWRALRCSRRCLPFGCTSSFSAST